ncbi:hypothetical protein, partial [Methylomonas koyamae]|uniref:hypothetical protein n=2 Tax=Methylomonas TaxID=416 RepID=UPI001E4659F7
KWQQPLVKSCVGGHEEHLFLLRCTSITICKKNLFWPFFTGFFEKRRLPKCKTTYVSLRFFCNLFGAFFLKKLTLICSAFIAGPEL